MQFITKKIITSFAAAVALGVSCASVNAAVTVTRSLFINDKPTLDATGLTLPFVMGDLAAELQKAAPRDPGLNRNVLWARMWQELGKNCGSATLNGFPNTCLTTEAGQDDQPGLMNTYRLVSVVNRFDLRDKRTFNDCGEYRLIYALQQAGSNSPISFADRAYLIFEAQVDNPMPGKEIGCRNLADFWASLSTLNTPAQRGAAIAGFFKNGLPAKNGRPATQAVIQPKNYQMGRGQLRANLFRGGPSRGWVLKEFRMAIGNAVGVNGFKQAPNKENGFGPLFADTAVNNTQEKLFRDVLVGNMAALYGSPTNIGFATHVRTNSAESFSQGGNIGHLNYTSQFARAPAAYKTAFNNKVNAINATKPAAQKLTASQVLNRLESITCAGCHQPGAFGLTTPGSMGPNQAFPDSLGFVHVSDSLSGSVYPLSPALNSVFLPARKRELDAFVAKAANTFATVPAASIQSVSNLLDRADKRVN
jgi:hypothetical protein